MARRHKRAPLRVLLNGRVVGSIRKDTSGAIDFQYDKDWLGWAGAMPVSLSLPLRETAYKGDPVVAVFDNLLPDSANLRKMVAERVGAAGIDAYSLLSEIGRDCVGALQFVPDDQEIPAVGQNISGEAMGPEEIEHLLKNLARAPLGLGDDEEFRISVAGAQEKTALLRLDGTWLRPHGTTPTTHIFKTQMGHLPNGIDLSNSVENEYYCLKLMSAFGLPVNHAEIGVFGETKALVIERFDRERTSDGVLHRIPQEDFCQALSVPPSRKYQSEGGPGMVDILERLNASDSPSEDQKKFLKAQVIFWLIGATDGHAKNFSIYLGSGGAFTLTPFYDVLTAQPSADAKQIESKKMKLAMSVGDNRHYKFEEIMPRHFVQTIEKAGLPKTLATKVFDEISAATENALKKVETDLPSDFPAFIHESVSKAVTARLQRFAHANDAKLNSGSKKH